ncbi:MAG TPA: hypothetical protein VMZ91_15870 [Candidatus Paceibacterota bacterium]|nr:hypothetical protein [Candidatus Paceibacterota bacterium]
MTIKQHTGYTKMLWYKGRKYLIRYKIIKPYNVIKLSNGVVINK